MEASSIDPQIGVTARFKHVCGHTSPDLTYASMRFAEGDRAAQEAGACVACLYGMTPEEFVRRARRKQAGTSEPLGNLQPDRSC